MYTKEYMISSTDVDFNQNLKLSSLLSIYQNIGMVHADLLNLGTDKLLNKGLIWIISRMRNVINRMPKYGETITIKTAPGTVMGVIMPRYYIVLDKDGNKLIESVGLWSVVDYNTRTLINPKEHDIFFKDEDIENLSNINALAVKKVQYTNSFLKRVEFTDLDLNGHMNNVKYANIIMNILNDSSIKNYSLKEYNVSFFKEARHLDEMKIEYVKEDGYINVFGSINNQKIFAGEIKYTL